MNKTGELLIQDFNNNLLAYLDPAECSVCYTDKELNGQNLMYITTDRTQYAAQFLVKNNRVMFFQHNKNKWQEYIISETTLYDETVDVQLESSLYATFQNWIEFVDITGNTVINGMQKAFTAAMPTPQWSPGRSDITGSYYMQRTRTNLKAWIFDWVAKVGGELEEEITIVNNKVVRKVNILSSIGADLGKTLYDDRDLTDINIKDPSRTIYTAAFGYGKMLDINDTGESQPTTFKDIVWTVAGGDPVDKPLGQEWVALPDEYKQKFGYYDINNVLQHSMGSYKEEGVEVPSELLRRTYDFLIDNVSDKTEYSISAIDLFALTNESIELNLGDMIGIEVKQLNYKHFRLKTMRYKESLIDSSENDFELNNTTSTIADVLVDNDSQISDLKDRVDGLIGGALTGSVLDKWNEEINKDASYFTYASPQDGLVVYNANTVTAATKATQLKGGSLRISNTKTSGQFNWTTVLTGDGIIATAIYTGILAGNMFDLDLDSGIVKMGTRNASGIIANPSLQLNADGSISMKIGGADLNTTITNINNTVGDLNTSVEDVVQKVENIAIGSVNLLKNSAYRKDINGVAYRGNHVASLDTTNKHNGNNTLKVVTTGAGAIGINDIYQVLWNTLEVQDNIMVSFYVKGSIASSGKVRVGNAESENGLVPFNVTTSWKLVTLDLGKIMQLSSSETVIMFIFDKAGTYYLNSIKVEKGTEATTWSPSPQDTTSDLTIVEQDVVIAQNNIVSLQTGLNGIQADVGQITTTLTTLKSAGSNLIRNTALVDGKKYWLFNIWAGAQIEPYTLSSSEFKSMAPPTGLDTLMMIITQNVDTSTNKYNYFYPATEVLPRGKAGKEYVISCWYYVPANGDIDNYVYFSVDQLNESGANLKTVTYKFPNYTVNQWHYAELKFTAVDGVATLRPIFAVANRQIVYFSSMYLGEGNVSTGWSPNEADINVEIKTTKTDLAQLHIETDNITQRVTKVEQQEIGVANVLKDSGTPIATDDYLIKGYGSYNLKPNTTYTVVMTGYTTTLNKKIGLWFNGDTVLGGFFPATTAQKTQVIKVTTPATITRQSVNFYNYPSNVTGRAVVNWIAMYEGDVKPPLTWTAAPEELAKISFVEQKTTAEALTTTISSGLASGSQIKTAKYIMDVNGFTIFNAALTMYQGADTSTKKILYFDNVTQNFKFVGDMETVSDSGKTKLVFRGGTIRFYTENGTNLCGMLYAGVAKDSSRPRQVMLGHDVGDLLVLGTAGENDKKVQVQLSDTNLEVWENIRLLGTVESKFGYANNVFISSDYIYSMILTGNPDWYVHMNTNIGVYGISIWSSDGRLKRNIAPAAVEATNVIKSIKHREFDWKDTTKGHVNVGYIAQELEEINKDFVLKIPQYKDPEIKDEIVDYAYQIDERKIIPYMTKAMQEMTERIEALESMLLSKTTGTPMTYRMMAMPEEQPRQYDNESMYLPPVKEPEKRPEAAEVVNIDLQIDGGMVE